MPTPPHLLSVQLAILGPFRMSLSDHGPITPWQPCCCSVLAEVPFALVSLCVCLTEFKQSSYFLESFWFDLEKMSKAEETTAEQRLVQLQGSNQVTNFQPTNVLASYEFQLQAVNKDECFCFVSALLLHAWAYVLWVIFVWNRENRRGLDKQRKGKDSCAITRWEAGTNDRAAG